MLYASLERPNADRPRSKSRTPAKIQRWAMNQAKSVASPQHIPEPEPASGNLATFSIPMRRSPRQSEVSSPSPRAHRRERRDELASFRLSDQKEENSGEELEAPDSLRTQSESAPARRGEEEPRRLSHTSPAPKTPKRRVSVDLSPPPLAAPSSEPAYDAEPVAVGSPVMEPAPTMNEETADPITSGPRPKSRLHHEISECCEQLRATSKEFQRRQRACERVSALIFDLWADVEVHLVGSTATHLFLSDSDIDIVVRAPEGEPELTMADLMQLGQHLERYATHLQVVSTASVPLIKMVDSVTKFTLDITLNVSTGLYSTALIMQYLDDFAPLKPLILVLKQLLKLHSLNELYRGGIPSYTLGLMIVSFLQFHTDNQKKSFNPAGDMQPGIESERHGEFEDFIRQTEREHARRAPSCSDSDSEAREMEAWEDYYEEESDEEPVVYRMNWQTDFDVGNLLLSFLELYGKSFDYTKHGITCKDGGGYFPKRTRKWWHPHDPTLLCLENPVDPSVDLGFKIYHIDRVRKLFASCLEHLTPDKYTGRAPCKLQQLLQLPGSGSTLGSPVGPERRLPRSRGSSPTESTLATPTSGVPSSPELDGKTRAFSLGDNTHNTHQKYNNIPAVSSSSPLMATRSNNHILNNPNNKPVRGRMGGINRGGGRPMEPRTRTESSNGLQTGRGGDRKNSVNSNSSGGWRNERNYPVGGGGRSNGNGRTTPRFSAQSSNMPRSEPEKGRRNSVSSVHSGYGSNNMSHHSSHDPPLMLGHRSGDSPNGLVKPTGAGVSAAVQKVAALSIQIPSSQKPHQHQQQQHQHQLPPQQQPQQQQQSQQQQQQQQSVPRPSAVNPSPKPRPPQQQQQQPPPQQQQQQQQQPYQTKSKPNNTKMDLKQESKKPYVKTNPKFH